MRKGFASFLVIAVIAVSLLITAAWTTQQKINFTTSSRAQTIRAYQATVTTCNILNPMTCIDSSSCSYAGLTTSFGGYTNDLSSLCSLFQNGYWDSVKQICSSNGSAVIMSVIDQTTLRIQRDNCRTNPPATSGGSPSCGHSGETCCVDPAGVPICLDGSNCSNNSCVGAPAVKPGGPVDYGQSSACTNAGGTCKDSSSGCGGSFQAGLCPGPSSWMCCVVGGGGGGAPAGGSGGSVPAGNPPPPAAPVRSNHLIGGLIQKSDSGAGLPGISVTIATIDSTGAALPINGQPTYSTLTDASGNWAALVALMNGDAYYVRPQNTGPVGYASAPRTTNDTHSKAANSGNNTPLNKGSYEQQVVGNGDCASTPGWANGACNFYYDPTAAGASGQPAETACLKPLLRYVKPSDNTHFYTSLWTELGNGDSTWKFEGVMGYVESENSPHCYSASSQPLYRFVNSTKNIHFYLLNNSTPPDATWKLEGMVGYVNPADDPSKFTTTLERFYNATTQDHFYTNVPSEAANLKAGGAYTYEFPAGWTFGDQALAASQGSQSPGGGAPGPANQPPITSQTTNTPPQTPGTPVVSTGTGGTGYKNFMRIAFDCTNGITVSAAYDVDPATPNDSTQPTIYYNVEKVTSTAQAGPGKGTLLGQGTSPNSDGTNPATRGTYNDPHVAWNSIGQKLQFYIYTFRANTDPATVYTIHGVDAAGNDVSAAPGQAPPQPYSIACPVNGTPQATPGQQGPGTGSPPPVSGAPDDSTVKKDMDITFKIFMADTPGGTATKTPVATSLPVDVTLTNATHADDIENVTVTANYIGSGVWQGKYSSSHYPGAHFSMTVWPVRHMRKTLCQDGPAAPQVLFPDTFQCSTDQGVVKLAAGANILDFSKINVGAGDLNDANLRDGHIDSQDLYGLQLMMKNPSPADTVKGDLNGDGVVNQEDYDLAVWSILHTPQ